MSRMPSAAPFWPYNLRQNLAGSFTACARGLFAPEFVLRTVREERCKERPRETLPHGV